MTSSREKEALRVGGGGAAAREARWPWSGDEWMALLGDEAMGVLMELLLSTVAGIELLRERGELETVTRLATIGVETRGRMGERGVVQREQENVEALRRAVRWSRKPAQETE